MLYGSHPILKAKEMSQASWKNSAYKLLNKEGKPDKLITFWNFWQEKNDIWLSALPVMTCWKNQQTHYTDSPLSKGTTRSVGANSTKYLNSFTYKGSEN